MTKLIYDPTAELVPTCNLSLRREFRYECVPDAARWWRIRLLTDDAGCLYYIDISNSHSAVLSWDDERDTTLHPHAINIEPIHEPHGDDEMRYERRTLTPTVYCYVDVLLVRQPDPRWTYITPVGHHWHPDHHNTILAEWERRQHVRSIIR